MKHPESEELVMHFYGEGETAATAAHLATCNECAREYEDLRLSLERLEETPVPVLPEDYGAKVWAAISPRVREMSAAPAKKSMWLTAKQWALFAGAAAVIAIAFFAGALWHSKSVPTPGRVDAALIDQSARERLLMSAVSDHLERSQMMLTEVMHTESAGQIDVAGEQKRADELIAANRIYRQTAEKNGDAALALVLEELERTLLEIANGPDKLSSTDLKRLRDLIEAEDLLFKVRVLKNKVYERTLPPPASGNDNRS